MFSFYWYDKKLIDRFEKTDAPKNGSNDEQLTFCHRNIQYSLLVSTIIYDEAERPGLSHGVTTKKRQCLVFQMSEGPVSPERKKRPPCNHKGYWLLDSVNFLCWPVSLPSSTSQRPIQLPHPIEKLKGRPGGRSVGRSVSRFNSVRSRSADLLFFPTLSPHCPRRPRPPPPSRK